MRAVIEKRPKGALQAVAEKIEYWTQEGHKTLYLVVSFLPLPSADGKGSVQRAIEFFMPLGQSGESQQWITSSMRLLSLAARGGFLSVLRTCASGVGPRAGASGTYQSGRTGCRCGTTVRRRFLAIQHIIDQRNSAPLDAWLAVNEADLAAMPPAMMGKKCSSAARTP